MKYAQKFELKCYDALRTYFKSRTDEYTGDQFHIFGVPDVSQEISDLFTSEMVERGLPVNLGWLMFKKRNCPGESHTSTHVDSHDNSIKVSIVIPIDGCENTHMYWCEGDYKIETLCSELTNGTTALIGNVVWKPEDQVEFHREVIDSPTICRVDIPHNTVTRADGSYRVVVTTRFLGKPSFEEVCEKLLK